MVSELRPLKDRRIAPKFAWLLDHRRQFPIDVNTAPPEVLLRLPGMGPRTVEHILRARRQRALAAADLCRLRLPWQQLRYFIAASDHRPPRMVDRASESVAADVPGGRQLDLFEPPCPL
ncbi:MAG: hypothetical protein IT424_09140 [Pirellulales bacterium]|nr:hypothetical protein [Pirellulales bacterium]